MKRRLKHTYDIFLYVIMSVMDLNLSVVDLVFFIRDRYYFYMVCNGFTKERYVCYGFILSVLEFNL